MCLLNLTSLRHHFLFRVWHSSDKRERFPFFIFASVISHSNLFNPWFCSKCFDFGVNRNGTFNFHPQIDHFYAILPYQRFRQFSKSCHRSTIGCCCCCCCFVSSHFYIDQIQDGSRVLSWGNLQEIRPRRLLLARQVLHRRKRHTLKFSVNFLANVFDSEYNSFDDWFHFSSHWFLKTSKLLRKL